jgi:signal transduction histidine kinase
LQAEHGFELTLDLRDVQIPVRVNRRMLRIVLQHLFTNAYQALVTNGRRQIDVRVLAGEEDVRCEIHDTGEGLPAEDWTRSLVPFFSTKGPFAKDPIHAAQEATGLGLTVSRHLLALHGGRLELRSAPGEGTTAVVVLPRADRGGAEAVPSTAVEGVRADVPGEARGPHPKSDWSSVREPPSS